MSNNITGTVIAVKLDAQIPYANKPGSYPGYQVVYTDHKDNQVKTLSKHMNTLKYDVSLRKGLESLTQGDEFTVVQEKVGQYLEVKAITKGADDNAAFSAAVASDLGTKPAAGGSYTPRNTSTYETPEERKLKQRLIVRQAALNQALEYDKDRSIEEVTKAAAEFETWVYRGLE